jgi:type III pantothenate kinase
MILCLDVGNTNLFGGVFLRENLLLRFRYDTKQFGTSDQIGLFLKNVLRENKIDPEKIEKIAICSVVPNIDYSLTAACKKYFNIEPFTLRAGVKTGIKIKTNNPTEVGADRIADAIAAINLYPNKNIIVIGLGTATTFCALSREKEYLGGVIMPGIRISMEALSGNTAKLSAVEIIKPRTSVGRTTSEDIQAGLYYGQLGAMHEITKLMAEEVFANEKPMIIGTGGFSHLFQDSKIFDVVLPDLVLHGLRTALEYNC